MKLLASYPKYFAVNYSINPWMDLAIQVDQNNSIEQWKGLIAKVEELGADVNLAEMPAQHLPDFVFTANAGMIINDKAIVSCFRDKERQGETPYFYDWFVKAGYNTLLLEPTDVWEGEACTFPVADHLLCSYGIRADKHTYKKILEHFEVPESKVIYAPIIDPYFYHLDVAFCPLDNDSALYCEMAFSGETIEWLKHHVKNLISVPYDDALNFTCNAVVVGKNIVMNLGVSEDIKEQVAAIGYTVHEVPITEYIKSGGGVKCLIMYIDRWQNYFK